MSGRFRDLSLRAKVALTLVAAFALVVAAFLVLLVPLERQQRARLLERDRRLLETLKDNAQRDLVYDLLSENEDSLALDLAALARQPGILLARVESRGVSASASADPAVLRRLLGPAAVVAPEEVLVVWGDGRASVVGPGGARPWQSPVTTSGVAPAGPTPAGRFETRDFGGETVLAYGAELEAADDVFGRLDVFYSLAELRRAEALTRGVVYALVGTAFVVLLVMLNVLLSRLVLAPVQDVLAAMDQARQGALGVRLPVLSRDEVGRMAESFNVMVAELAASKHAIEDYSRNLEGMVAERTRALRESEERLRDLTSHLETVLAHVATGVVSLDAEGRVATVNERAAAILGLGRDATGRLLRDALGDGEAARLADVVSGVVSGSAPLHTEQLTVRLGGTRRTLSVVASSLPGATRPAGTVVVIDDVTELIATQRLSAWKEAVERVIHEIKNPLTPVGLAADTLKTAYGAGDRARFDAMFPSAIEMILNAVRTLKALISDFTRFSRLPKVNPRPEDVNALVREALAFFAQRGDDGVVVRAELADDLPPVEADAEPVRRVLLNLVGNAVEAMAGRPGDVVVTTARSEDPARVRIAVSDRGPGIEDVERAFEPYYTTKVKGTGLGLPISRQIVEEHGGELRLSSRLGEGTTAEVLLPVAPGS